MNQPTENSHSSQLKNSIQLLPEHIIDQIKAGEVIERPSLLLKELIENSVDALSSEIHIHLINNGLDLISIEDNGKGMNYDEVPYAFLRHATSKLEKFEDLYHLRSYGFRGEALASLQSIARVTCQTIPSTPNESGAKYIINGGIEELHIKLPQTKEHGTKLYIKDLFFNTPVRLNFIKSKQSEKLALKKIIQNFVMAHPQITFSIKWDDLDKEFFPRTMPFDDSLNPILQCTEEELKKRFMDLAFQGKKKECPVIFLQSHYEHYAVKGFFTREAFGARNQHQYIFVNNRIVYEKSLVHLLQRQFESLWPKNEMGMYAIFLFVPPEDLDVNIHPNKTVVKFLKNETVYTLIANGISHALKKFKQVSNNHTHEMQYSSDSNEFNESNESNDHSKVFSPMPNYEEQTSRTTLSFTKGEVSTLGTLSLGPYLLYKKETLILTHRPLATLKHWFNRIEKTLQKSRDHIQLNLERSFEGIESTDSSPLLISEPILKITDDAIKKSIPTKINFTLLEELGFEVEFIQNELLVLRSSPNSWSIQESKIFLQFFVGMMVKAHPLYPIDPWIKNHQEIFYFMKDFGIHDHQSPSNIEEALINIFHEQCFPNEDFQNEHFLEELLRLNITKKIPQFDLVQALEKIFWGTSEK